MKKWTIIILVLFITLFFGYKGAKKLNSNTDYEIGQPIDSLNKVIVYYNGSVGNVSGRNLASDGYNIGLKYQCVEFVKRYYYEYFKHRMPDSWGHAKSFFNPKVRDGKINGQRNLRQFTNPSKSKPKESDLIVMDGTTFNKYGHVAIVSNVTENKIEIIQQNPGPFSSSRETFRLVKTERGKWEIESSNILGWLRK